MVMTEVEIMESVVLTIIVLAIGFIGGYAVLRKKVQDLEINTKKKLDSEKHEDLCKIAGLEMKKHISDTMKDTLDDFKVNDFKPAMKQLLAAINGEK